MRSDKIWVVQAHYDFEGSEFIGLTFNIRDAKSLAREFRLDNGFSKPLKWERSPYWPKGSQTAIRPSPDNGVYPRPGSYSIEKVSVYRRQSLPRQKKKAA